MVLSFWFIQAYNFIMIHLTYSSISHFFYLSYLFTVISLPLVIMVISRIILGFILMIHNNQDLIKTIKRILEVFPEAIIIQSFDKDTSKLVLQFTNQAAKKEVIDYPDSSGKPIDEQHLNYVIKTYDDVKDKTHSEFNDDQSESYSLTELLHIHAYSVQTNGAEGIPLICDI